MSFFFFLPCLCLVREFGWPALEAPTEFDGAISMLIKSFRMLEDPSYSETVRWGDDGTSFVVLEVRIGFATSTLR